MDNNIARGLFCLRGAERGNYPPPADPGDPLRAVAAIRTLSRFGFCGGQINKD